MSSAPMCLNGLQEFNGLVIVFITFTAIHLIVFSEKKKCLVSCIMPNTEESERKEDMCLPGDLTWLLRK